MDTTNAETNAEVSNGLKLRQKLLVGGSLIGMAVGGVILVIFYRTACELQTALAVKAVEDFIEGETILAASQSEKAVKAVLSTAKEKVANAS